MHTLAVLLTLAVVGGDRAHELKGETAADRLTLRDGTVIRGLVTTTNQGARGSVEMIVRREWAAKNARKSLDGWERAEAAAAKTINEQRRRRLSVWKRERSQATTANDAIMRWIDRQLAMLADPAHVHRSTLLSVRIPRGEVLAIDRPSATVERFLRLGWLSKLRDPENTSVEELKISLEGRGYDVEAATRAQPPDLDSLLAMGSETEAQWFARRAATEVSVDDGVRFIRFNDIVMPDSGGGVPAAGDMNVTAALSELKRVLDIDSGPRTDPLVERLRAVEARGRIGAVVTRLVIAPDMSGVNAETTLWIRTGPEQWNIYGSRQSRVRTDDLGADAGKGLDQDPQVQGAFRMVEMLGLGAIPAELKQRSLRIGAATQKGLGEARAAFHQDLEKLALPVLEPEGDGDKTDQAAAQRKPS